MSDPEIDPERLERELMYMKELIASDPDVHARFDTDGNGIIDGDEWLAVRDMVISRMKREEAERQAILAQRVQSQPAEPTEERPESHEPEGQPEPMPELDGFTPPEPIPEGQIAGKIYRKDLRRLHVDEKNRDLSHLDSFAGLRSFVLRTQNPFQYSVLTLSGDEVGEIKCRNSGLIEELKARLPIGGRDWKYEARDHLADATYRMEVDAGVAGKKAMLFDGADFRAATVSRGVRVLRSKITVDVARTRERFQLRQSVLDAWHVTILDGAGNEVGEMDKDVESLLGAINPFGKELWRIDVEGKVSNDAMVAILLGAVFVDTDEYDRDPKLLM